MRKVAVVRLLATEITDPFSSALNVADHRFASVGGLPGSNGFIDFGVDGVEGVVLRAAARSEHDNPHQFCMDAFNDPLQFLILGQLGYFDVKLHTVPVDVRVRVRLPRLGKPLSFGNVFLQPQQLIGLAADGGQFCHLGLHSQAQLKEIIDILVRKRGDKTTPVRNDLEESLRFQPVAGLTKWGAADLVAIGNHRLFEKLAGFEVALDDVLAHQFIDLFGELFGRSIFGDSWHSGITDDMRSDVLSGQGAQVRRSESIDRN